MSKDRRSREQVAAGIAPIHGTEPLPGLGLTLVPGSFTKWFAYRTWSDGRVEVLTPMYHGKLVGESQWAASGRFNRAVTQMMLKANETLRVARVPEVA